MISLVENEHINREIWDRTVRYSPDENIFSYSWYLDIVSPGWKALVLKDYEYVLPVPEKSFFKIPYIIQPPFTQQLGIIGHDIAIKEVLDVFLDFLKKNYLYVNIYLNENNYRNLKGLDARHNYVISLSQGYHEIYNNYTRRLKRYLRSAPRHHPEIINLSPEKVVSMYACSKGAQQKGHQDAVLLKLIQTATEKGIAKNYGLKYGEGDTSCSACILQSEKRVMYFKSTSLPEGRKNRGMHYLIDRVIQEHAGSDKMFDFVGSIIPSIEDFYRSFGANCLNYPDFLYSKMSLLTNWFKN